MEEGKGYISLHRELQDHWLWKITPFSKGQAWIDLLLRTSYLSHEYKGEIQERGNFTTSILNLSESWGWSRHKVKDFLILLQNDSMIELKSDNRKSTINIVNYSLWQNVEEKKDTKRTTKGQQKDTTNKGNKENNIYIVVSDVINYLNLKTSKNYKSTTTKNISLITARQNEKFILEDFKKVIDIKCAEWIGTDWEKFLRPETLFGNKFEGYLNQEKKIAYKNKIV
jgi:uncharacterized phage protein (TIGR02220 family)